MINRFIFHAAGKSFTLQNLFQTHLHQLRCFIPTLCKCLTTCHYDFFLFPFFSLRAIWKKSFTLNASCKLLKIYTNEFRSRNIWLCEIAMKREKKSSNADLLPSISVRYTPHGLTTFSQINFISKRNPNTREKNCSNCACNNALSISKWHICVSAHAKIANFYSFINTQFSWRRTGLWVSVRFGSPSLLITFG